MAGKRCLMYLGLDLGIFHISGAGLFLFIANNDLVCLHRVSVVKHSKQIFAWSINSFAKKVVGEKEAVALVVQLVVTISRGSFEPLLRGFLQLSSTESSKLLVE